MKPRVFVSHAAHRDPATMELVDATVAALAAAGYDPFVDKAIEPGTDYRPEIEGELPSCHCGVVFLSQAALDSRWVEPETSLMGIRHRLPGGFRLIPVLVPPMQPAEFSGWDAAAVDRTQMVRATDRATTAAKVVKALEPVMNRFSSGPELDWELRLQGLLKPAVDQALVQAAQRLEDPDRQLDTWPWEVDKKQSLARALLELKDVDKVLDVAEELALYAPGVDALQVYEIAAPFAWIEWKAAGCIANLAKEDGERRAVALNTSQSSTCRMYVKRSSARLAVVDVTNVLPEFPVDEEAEVLEAVTLELTRELRVAAAGSSSEVMKRILARRPVVLVVPFPPPSRETLNAVAEKFASLIFFFKGGDQLGGVELDPFFKPVRVDPGVDPDVERCVLDVDEIARPLLVPVPGGP
jgi:hypothetical protein